MKNGTARIALGMLAALCAEAVLAEPAPPSVGIYTCTDRNGRRITADRPIAECLDREQRELSPSGTVRRSIGPSLTEEERAAQDVQRRKEAEERARIQEERRRDRALLSRYPNQAAHDAERALALQQIDEVAVVARKRIVELQEQRKQLNSEMEFYAKDPAKAPALLKRRLVDNDEEVQQQQRVLAGQDDDKRRVHKRFDAELAQLRKLWAPQPPPSDTAAH